MWFFESSLLIFRLHRVLRLSPFVFMRFEWYPFLGCINWVFISSPSVVIFPCVTLFLHAFLLSRPGYHSVLVIIRFFRNVGWVGVLRWFIQRFFFVDWLRCLVLVYGDTQWILFPVQFWVCRRLRDDCCGPCSILDGQNYYVILHSKVKMDIVLPLMIQPAYREPNERVEDREGYSVWSHDITRDCARKSLTIFSVSIQTEIRANTNRTTPASLNPIYHSSADFRI